jgi:hypothetical protein
MTYSLSRCKKKLPERKKTRLKVQSVRVPTAPPSINHG